MENDAKVIGNFGWGARIRTFAHYKKPAIFLKPYKANKMAFIKIYNILSSRTE
jgi:hypothetical protein